MLPPHRHNLRLLYAGLLLVLFPSLAHGYGVEEGSLSNRVEMVLENQSETDALVDILVYAEVPGFCDITAPIEVPTSVEPGASDVAVLEFDVTPDTPLATSGTVTLTVSGVVSGTPVETTVQFALAVEASVPAVQGHMTAVPTGWVPILLLPALALVSVFMLRKTGPRSREATQ